MFTIMILGYLYKFKEIENMSNPSNHCKNLEIMKNKISSVDYDNKIYCNNIRDFYVKTAYNCCATGDFKNGLVDICAMKNCIKQGVRCLDFGIYNIDLAPEVAVSDKDTFLLKGSLNSIPLDHVLTAINDNAFNPNVCPNSTDPLFLHLRIKSGEESIYTKIANLLELYLSDKLLDTQKYGHEYYNSSDDTHKNIGALPLNHPDIKGKIIIMVQINNKIDLKDTHLDKYANITSVPSDLDLEKKTNAAPFLSCKYNNEIINTHSMNNVVNNNKHHMTICLPDLSKIPNNPNPTTLKLYGCQFIAMSFQKYDTNLEIYNTLFDRQAFILKPKHLRYIKQYVERAKDNPPHIGLGTCGKIEIYGPASQKEYHI